MRVEISVHEGHLRAPFVSARDTVTVRRLVVLTLTGEDGVAGHGEAAPLPGYDGVTVERVVGELEACRPLLERAGGAEREALIAHCGERAGSTQALAAIDVALWDLAGRRAGEPVWSLLGAAQAGAIEVNATIGAVDRTGAAREASAARASNYGTVKVKVGVGDDAGRLAATRAAAGPEMSIRIDAGGAWSPGEAIAALHALAPVGIECCEEPCHGLQAVGEVARAVGVPVSIDETAAEPEALRRRVCDAVCLKLTRSGGISGLVRDAARARAAGYELYLASTLDGPLGIAAALHAAVAIAPERACGLATLELFERECVPLSGRGGAIAPPRGAGLGDGLLDWYGPPA